MASDVSPHDLDAERHVLGAVLVDTEAIHRVLSILGEQTTVFFKAAHQLIYAAALRLTQRSDPIDLYTIANELKRSDDLSRVGGVAYLYEVHESVPTAANAEYYAETVRDKSTRRALVHAGTEIIGRAGRDDVELEEVVDQAQRILFEVNYREDRGFVDIEQVLRETMEYIEQLYKRKDKLVGIPTGLPDLDQLLYGLNPADLMVVAARPSMGKSAFAHNIAANVACRSDEDRQAVAIFTLEMGREQILTRMLATLGRIDMSRIRQGTLNSDDWRRLSEAAGQLETAQIFINDTPGITLMEVRAESRRLKMRYPNLGLVIVDYLQMLQGGTRAHHSREQEISDYSRSLKELARELDVTVMALSQLNRAVESRNDRRPMLSDLRESGAIEQDADIVMFLYRDDYYNENSETAGQVEIIVRKHRNGALGTVVLDFQNQYLLFKSSDHMPADYV
ncbi:replicative DNA helicase [Candidatus Poribacteria bacterium]|nr:replicative DNA helicase [Candidatus Poribacteria bacterium]MBT5534527.1 replicative DNA helicase [Candidatus Poribacteria bacterium]MBT7097671.1 replicative DNA helicase [Candidatus Poribacteria bacterium]MBT7808279.1 replicative DNA helicase [Candidatus Poribacteria bacterium]